MSNFILIDLPKFDLKLELDNMFKNGKLKWSSLNQICINSVKGKADNYLYGCGSLYYDWANGKTIIDNNGNEKLVNNVRETPLRESDFTELCDVFKNTLFENVYNILKNNYELGRIRLMKSPPKTCLSWHVDDTKRIHYPIKTQEGCFMIIDQEIKHLPQNSWWLTNTLIHHTAMNASLEDRIHLVATMLD